MITEQQRHDRMKGIGGSDVAIILGLSNYKTPYQLYLEKTGQVESPLKATPFQEWGNRLEPVIRKKYAEKNGVLVLAPVEDVLDSPPSEFVNFSLDTIVHPMFEFMRANLDGFIPERNIILETKCANSFMAKEWGDEQTDVIPPAYLCQVAHYVSCMNAEGADIAVLIGGYDYREYHYKRDISLEDSIIEACKQFWACVQNRTPPKAVNTNDLRLQFPKSSAKKITATSEIERYLDNLNNYKTEIKDFQKSEEECKFKILEFMRENDTLVSSSDEILATYKSNKNGTRSFRVKE